jgi:hypothetical protein
MSPGRAVCEGHEHGPRIRPGGAMSRSVLVMASWVLLCSTGPGRLSAQTLTGSSGLVSIPTATLARDGQITVGVHLIAPHYHEYYGRTFEENAAQVRFATIGFLPFVEVGLRLTHMNGGVPQGIGDRMVSVRVRLLKEGERLPSVAIGAHDIVGTRLFHATYVVATKSIGTPAGAAGVTVGYGHDVLGLRAKGRQFDGLFGGMSLAPHRWVTLLAEYDGERPNAGVRLGPVHGVALLAALQNGDGFSGGVSYTFALH